MSNLKRVVVISVNVCMALFDCAGGLAAGRLNQNWLSFWFVVQISFSCTSFAADSAYGGSTPSYTALSVAVVILSALTFPNLFVDPAVL